MRRITCVSDGGTIEVAARTTRLAPFPLWESGRAGATTRPFSTSRASTVLSANEKPDLQPLPPWLSHQGALSAVSQQPCEPLKKNCPFAHSCVDTRSSLRPAVVVFYPRSAPSGVHIRYMVLIRCYSTPETAAKARVEGGGESKTTAVSAILI